MLKGIRKIGRDINKTILKAGRDINKEALRLIGGLAPDVPEDLPEEEELEESKRRLPLHLPLLQPVERMGRDPLLDFSIFLPLVRPQGGSKR